MNVVFRDHEVEEVYYTNLKNIYIFLNTSRHTAANNTDNRKEKKLAGKIRQSQANEVHSKIHQ